MIFCAQQFNPCLKGSFGIISKRMVIEKYVPIIAVIAPILSFGLQYFAAKYFSYEIGFELLGYNALFMILGLSIVSYSKSQTNTTT
jgi:hypothetical protein